MNRSIPVLLLVLLLAACNNDPKPLTLEDIRLQRFSSCDAMDTARVYREPASTGDGREVAVDDFAPAAENGSTTGETNLQVAGVDEMDVAKADGDFIYRVTTDRTIIQVLRRAPSGDAALLQEIEMADDVGATGLFVTEDKVVVIGNTGSFGWYPGGPIEVPMEMRMETGVSVPKIHLLFFARGGDGTLMPEGERTIDGTTVAARMTGTILHLVSQRYIDPIHDGSGEPSEEVLPVSSFGSTTVRLRDCTDILHEPRAGESESGLPTVNGLVGVLSMDVNDPEGTPTGEWVAMNDASVIYASATNLFVASYGWFGALPIHQFALADGTDPTRYVGSGLADGWLLNQFSMDESEGYLRVASTIQPDQMVFCSSDACEARVSEPDNAVTTFELTGGDFETSGKLAGLGAGETIYAVRFLGKVGFVVTFRQTDPLFTIDLSDPENPRLRGELVMPGFSNYLHPIAEGYLLGVGQNADENGSLGSGMLMSLFDVRDLDHPAIAHQVVIGDGYVSSEALDDHKAFRFIPEEELIVLPLRLDSSTEAERFRIYRLSIADGFSLAGESIFADQEWSSGSRSFYRDGVISLVGGGELVVRDADAPGVDVKRIGIE